MPKPSISTERPPRMPRTTICARQCANATSSIRLSIFGTKQDTSIGARRKLSESGQRSFLASPDLIQNVTHHGLDPVGGFPLSHSGHPCQAPRDVRLFHGGSCRVPLPLASIPP